MRICPQCQRLCEDSSRFCPIDGSLLREAPAGPDPFAGKTIGRLRLIEKIADGDIGAIYKAEDPVRGSVAVQVLPPGRITSSVLLEAFSDAVNLAAKLDHPNVIRTYGLETGQDGSTGVAMELISGTTLRAYSRNNPGMEPLEACRLIRQAADAVRSAHMLSMLHSALQPDRILVTRDGLVKVGGFFRSGLREGTDPSSVTPGNLPYLAPERLGIVQDILPDYRIDVYSLGVILYELLCGRLPYDAQTVQELSKMAGGPEPPGPAFVNPKVATSLSRVVMSAISVHPQGRQSSMEQFARELESVGQPLRVPARAMPPPPLDSFSPADYGRKGSGAAIPDKPRMHDRGRDLFAEDSEVRKKDRSMFSWFQTRESGSGRLDSRRDRRSMDKNDNSFYGPQREDDDGKTVLVEDDSFFRPRKRKSSDSFSWPERRDRDVSVVDYLPKRSFLGNWRYILLSAAVLLVAAIVVAFVIRFIGKRAGPVNIPASPPASAQLPQEQPIPEVQEPIQPTVPVMPAPKPPVVQAGSPAASGIEERFNAALREYRFFPPPDLDNAWEILEQWKRSNPGSVSDVLPKVQQRYCREMERYGQDQLQRNLPKVYLLLNQKKQYDAESNCLLELQADFGRKMDQKHQDLRELIENRKFVLPEQDNALAAALEIRSIVPDDKEAADALQRIWQQAIRDAQAKSVAHQHAEAKRIYEQLRNRFPNPPGGGAILDEGIEKQNSKLELLAKIKDQFVSIPVKHPHPRSWPQKANPFGKSGDCRGNLSLNETEILYNSPLEPTHSFHVPFERIMGLSLKGESIQFKIDKTEWHLDALDLNGQKNLAEIPHRIEEIKKLYTEYNKP